MFALLADIVTDTINDLLKDARWDSEITFCPKIHQVPGPKSLGNIPFPQARTLSVQMPEEDQGKSDVFLDDIITCAVDIGNNLDRITKAPITIIEAVANQGDTAGIKRDDMVEMEKAAIEGPAEEIKIVLGWKIDTRRLLVSLPEHKFIAWTTQIDETLKNKTVSNDTLMSILGRPENAAQILVILGHFFSNIKHLQMIAEKKKRQNIRLNQRTKDDLLLAKEFLFKMQQGVSMNLLTFREPTNLHICDASEDGLGSFADHGRTWT